MRMYDNGRVILRPDFFDRPPAIVARALIGKYLVRKIGGRTIVRMITETEAYGGSEDLASHARFGRTARTAPMFGQPGTMYVYLTYGMHWLINVSCQSEGIPSAVLLRGVESVSGPARLTKALSIGHALTGKPLGRKTGLWIEDRAVAISKREIAVVPRIGIDYAGPIWSQKKWRFAYAPQSRPIGAARKGQMKKTRGKNKPTGRTAGRTQ